MNSNFRHFLWVLLFTGCISNTQPTKTFVALPENTRSPATNMQEAPTPTDTPIPTNTPAGPLELETIITGGDIPLSQPNDIELDQEGNIYVLDGKNNLIQVFDPSGVPLLSWGGTGREEGLFNFYSRTYNASFGCIAIGPSGDLYVSDFYNNRVQVFSRKGEFLRAWKILQPVCLAVDSQENVYVIDTVYILLHKFDAEGNSLLEMAGKESGEGSLRGPFFVAIDQDDMIWVTDFEQNRVMTYDPTGRFLAAYGDAGTMSGPTGIAIDGYGNFYTTEWKLSRLKKFDPSGLLIWSFPGDNEQNILLNEASGIEVDAEERIYIADYANDRILIFRQNW